MKRWAFAIGFLLTGVFLGGCGAAPTAVAPRHNLQPVLLREFPRQDWRLPNNKFFLWRDGLTAPQVSRAQALSRELDDLDTASVPLIRRSQELTALAEPIKDEIRALSDRLRPIKTDYDRAVKKKSDTEKALAKARADLAAEKAKPAPDPAVVAALEAQIVTLTTQLDQAVQQIALLKPQKDALDSQIAKKRGELAPLQEELDEVEAKQFEIQAKGQAAVEEIMRIVDWFKDQPTAVVFQFERDGIHGSIAGWNLGDDAGARDFSTRAAPGMKPTMGNISYTERGGVFRFEAYVFKDRSQTELRETYSFKISRTKYDSPDGRVFFTGDITKTWVADGKNFTRRGIAKLVDRNN